MTAASVESCQFVVLTSPRGRLGSVPYTCNRLRRLRRRFQRKIHLPICISGRIPIPQNAKVWDPELSGDPQASPHAEQATTRPQTYPRGSPRADLHPQKVNNLDPMAPRSRQKRQLPEGPQ